MNINFSFRASLMVLICMAVPFVGMTQAKNVTTTNRVFPKVDKVLEFEKALSAHAKKYHMGDTKWRVLEIQSGNDAGGYQVTEGPSSWEGLDKRGNMGDEHNIDWNKNVAVYLTEKGSTGYFVYQDSLSTVAVGDYSDKINIAHIYPKVGHVNHVWDMIEKMKAAWTAGGMSVAVYMASSSGPAQYAVVTRYKEGLKERAQGFRKPFKQIYESVHGEDSWEDYMNGMRQYVNDSWSELLFHRADLSSK